jgi:hypothetical protein
MVEVSRSRGFNVTTDSMERLLETIQKSEVLLAIVQLVLLHVSAINVPLRSLGRSVQQRI